MCFISHFRMCARPKAAPQGLYYQDNMSIHHHHTRQKLLLPLPGGVPPSPSKSPNAPSAVQVTEAAILATSRSLIVYRISVHSSMAFLLLTVLAGQLDE